ncbi:MAG TPA: hypothetical protein VFL27_05000 [Candidatus Dormibacteraeota bacterium]|nr:hypothetical protein [Candidatus Dormibacteraeota bacterium]
MIRGAAAAAGVFVALLPGVASAATAPDPAQLRAALADPVESNFIEAEVGTQGTLEGPFDINTYSDYYRLTGASDADVKLLQQHLQRDGFAGGYGREWYRAHTTDLMGELVMVFRDAAGASASEQASKLRTGEDQQFESFVDVSGLGAHSFAATINSTYGYRFTEVAFVKGNGLFAVSRGSVTGYQTAAAMVQARRVYANAPSSIAVPGEQAPSAAIVSGARLALILFLIAALAVAAIVSMVVVLRPGARAAAR